MVLEEWIDELGCVWRAAIHAFWFNWWLINMHYFTLLLLGWYHVESPSFINLLLIKKIPTIVKNKTSKKA